MATPGEGAPKAKSALVLAAEAVKSGPKVAAGYVRKENSASKFQRRYFEIRGGRYWVYYKSQESSEILCAMDLWRASAPALVPPGAGDVPDTGDVFSITWDRDRLFKAANHADAVRWVDAIVACQAQRPATMARVDDVVPAFATPGGGPDDGSMPSRSAASEAEEWPPRRADKGGRGGAGMKAQEREPAAPRAAACCACCVIS